MTMTTAPDALAALDFDTERPVCQWQSEHHGATPPATYRAVKTCGCASLVCGTHAELTRQAHNAAVSGEIPAAFCQACGARPVLLAALERIPA